MGVQILKRKVNHHNSSVETSINSIPSFKSNSSNDLLTPKTEPGTLDDTVILPKSCKLFH